LDALLATARRQLFMLLWDATSGRFNYNTRPIGPQHIRPEARPELAERLRRAGATLSDGVEAALNELLYAGPDDARLERVFEALCGSGRARPAAKAERVAEGKRALARLDAELWQSAFSDSVQLESDALFADQLIGDFYLRKLALPPISSADQVASVLSCLYRVSFLGNSPIVGVANLVQRDGQRLPAFQAQDVWVGVTFTVLELMREHGLHAEYDHVFNQLCDIVYDVARIPFGIPEGFNCTHDAPMTSADADRSALELARRPAVITPATAATLRLPLFTAGRYMRPGSIFSLFW
ncbi:MAG TPA: GH116 family glycosyl hydrolase, partial [Polyangiaceae bacterium]|nr:GH116 family glycosyl hydrolase [Polyangiaceae bacterium]